MPWEQHSRTQPTRDLHAAQDRLVLLQDDAVVCLQAGRALWEKNITCGEPPIEPQPFVDGDVLVVCDIAKSPSVLGLSLKSGEVVWQHKAPKKILPESLWTGQGVTYFLEKLPREKRRLYELNSQTGALLRTTEIPFGREIFPVGERVFLEEDRQLGCLDASRSFQVQNLPGYEWVFPGTEGSFFVVGDELSYWDGAGWSSLPYNVNTRPLASPEERALLLSVYEKERQCHEIKLVELPSGVVRWSRDFPLVPTFFSWVRGWGLVLGIETPSEEYLKKQRALEELPIEEENAARRLERELQALRAPTIISLLDPQTGKEHSTLPMANGRGLAWIRREDNLLVCMDCYGEATLFEWRAV